MTVLLRLLPLHLCAADLELLHWLGGALARRVRVQPVLDPAEALDPAWLHPHRDRLHSNRVVDDLVERRAPGGDPSPREWTLALTALDLHAPGRDFVFGEATLGGPCALVSLARLHEPHLPDDTGIVRARLLKEALHELGHLAGLDHCARARCVMAPSADAREVDRKGADFCPACRDALDRALDRRSTHD